MDRGAARSRKRAQQLEKVAATVNAPFRPSPRQGDSNARHTRKSHVEWDNAEAGPSRHRQKSDRGPPSARTLSTGVGEDEGHGPKEFGRRNAHNRQPDQLQAFRDSRRSKEGKGKKAKKAEKEEQSRDPALYRPKAIRESTALIYAQEPFSFPPNLRKVTRVDLTGSGAEDVSWIKESEVTWLSLNGCKITKGWGAIGSLEGLTVLNVSDCGLEKLPESLKGLKGLKAFVGMNNPWKALDDTVVSSWTQLNSLIVSHSPKLSQLPPSLSTLSHLSKLTFSHCPSLTRQGIPDLSSLPLLRDLKMNNLPLLQSLPDRLSQWGRGDLSTIESFTDEPSTTIPRSGAGLQSLDLGNCSLDPSCLKSFLSSTSPSSAKDSPSFPNLRSLTLHGNPLCETKPDYVQALVGSVNLPRLQIVDNKRVKEKVKREQGDPAQADAAGRKYAVKGPAGVVKGHRLEHPMPVPSRDPQETSSSAKAKFDKAADGSTGEADISTKRKRAQDPTETGKSLGPSDEIVEGPKHKRSKHGENHVDKLAGARDGKVTVPSTAATKDADPSMIPVKGSGPSRPNKAPKKSETSVVGVIDVVPSTTLTDSKKHKKHKEKKGPRGSTGDGSGVAASEAGAGASGGIDLRALFGGKTSGDTGLGTGGW